MDKTKALQSDRSKSLTKISILTHVNCKRMPVVIAQPIHKGFQLVFYVILKVQLILEIDVIIKYIHNLGVQPISGNYFILSFRQPTKLAS